MQLFDLASVSFCHDAIVENWPIAVGSMLLSYVDLNISSNILGYKKSVQLVQKRGMDMLACLLRAVGLSLRLTHTGSH
jgi:hypothetical protein